MEARREAGAKNKEAETVREIATAETVKGAEDQGSPLRDSPGGADHGALMCASGEPASRTTCRGIRTIHRV